MCSAVQCSVYWSLYTALQVFRLRVCVRVFVHGCVRLSLSLSVCANACKQERRNTSSRGTRKMHYKYRRPTQDTLYAISVTGSCTQSNARSNLTGSPRYREISGAHSRQSLQTLFLPQKQFLTPLLAINARALPRALLLVCCVFQLLPTAISLRASVEQCPWPPSSYSMTIQLGFEASPKATQTKINVGTVGEVFMQFLFLFFIFFFWLLIPVHTKMGKT